MAGQIPQANREARDHGTVERGQEDRDLDGLAWLLVKNLTKELGVGWIIEGVRGIPGEDRDPIVPGELSPSGDGPNRDETTHAHLAEEVTTETGLAGIGLHAQPPAVIERFYLHGDLRRVQGGRSAGRTRLERALRADEPPTLMEDGVRLDAHAIRRVRKERLCRHPAHGCSLARTEAAVVPKSHGPGHGQIGGQINDANFERVGGAQPVITRQLVTEQHSAVGRHACQSVIGPRDRDGPHGACLGRAGREHSDAASGGREQRSPCKTEGHRLTHLSHELLVLHALCPQRLQAETPLHGPADRVRERQAPIARRTRLVARHRRRRLVRLGAAVLLPVVPPTVAVVRPAVAAVAAVTPRHASPQGLTVGLRYARGVRATVDCVTGIRVHDTPGAVVGESIGTRAGRLSRDHLAGTASSAGHPRATLILLTRKPARVIPRVARASGLATVHDLAVAEARTRHAVARVRGRVDRGVRMGDVACSTRRIDTGIRRCSRRAPHRIGRCVEGRILGVEPHAVVVEQGRAT